MSDSPVRRSFESWIVALLIIAFCLGAVWLSFSFAKMPPILKRGIQPSDFPQLVCICIIFMTLYMVWRDPVKVAEPMGSKTLGSMALMLLFVLICSFDLFVALAVFAAGLCIYWGERRVGPVVLVGLLVPTAVFFLFDLVFKIRFPRGYLTNMWYG